MKNQNKLRPTVKPSLCSVKPCPICGRPGAITTKIYSFGPAAYKPHCSNGSCLLWTVDKEYKTEDGAAKAWNRRSEEVKHGKWIPTIDSDGEAVYENCSVCGMQFRAETVADCGIYCSYCGVKMEEEDND